MKHHFPPLPAVSAEEARRVWAPQRRPSARTVATALSLAGRPVHFTTINRWRKRGWCTPPSEHPLDRARAALDSAIPLLTGNTTTDVADLVHKHPEADELRQLSDRELITRAAREIAIASIICAEVLIKRATQLISTKPKEGSVLMFALGQCLKAVVIAFIHGGQLKPVTSFFGKGTGNFFAKSDRG
jgi:hypothetical protein